MVFWIIWYACVSVKSHQQIPVIVVFIINSNDTIEPRQVVLWSTYTIHRLHNLTCRSCMLHVWRLRFAFCIFYCDLGTKDIPVHTLPHSNTRNTRKATTLPKIRQASWIVWKSSWLSNCGMFLQALRISFWSMHCWANWFITKTRRSLA